MTTSKIEIHKVCEYCGKMLVHKNVTTTQISEVYGKRIGDRLKETTEIVPLLNGSYRG